MYAPEFTNQFKKSYKRMLKRGANPELLETILKKLCSGEPLSPKNKEHNLSGNYTGFTECHIQPDWLLVYIRNEETLTIIFTDTGTHSDLF
jgi:mRNA interferase YafQ